MSTRSEATAQTRERLLDEALTLFSQRGYAATGIRDILKAAGVTQPTLYHHFADKAAVLQTLIEFHYGESQSKLEQVLDEYPECELRLRAMVLRSFEFCCVDPRVPRLMFQTYYGPRVPEIDGILDRLTSKRFRLVTKVMQAGVERGELKTANPEFLALSFCCLMDQPINVFSRKTNPRRYLTKELANALVTLFLSGAR